MFSHLHNMARGDGCNEICCMCGHKQPIQLNLIVRTAQAVESIKLLSVASRTVGLVVHFLAN